jgi:hypothetical protein
MVIAFSVGVMVVCTQFCAVICGRVAALRISLVMTGYCRWTVQPSKFRRFCPKLQVSAFSMLTREKADVLEEERINMFRPPKNYCLAGTEL